jgi:hypothetical protein
MLRSARQFTLTQQAPLALRHVVMCPIWLAAVLAVLGEPALALEQSAAPATCDTPAHHQMDFWVGDWQVFDAATNQLVAFDRVEKQYAGCILQENLTFVTDMYRRPGVKVRLAGIAVNRFDGDTWLQMWADNQWGAILLRGTANAAGNMEFVSVIPSRKRDVKLVYEKHPDGTLRILQYVAPAGSGKWAQYGDLIYRPNH